MVTCCAFCAGILSGCYHGKEFVYHDPDIGLHEYEMFEMLRNTKGRKIKKVKTDGLVVNDTIYAPEEPKAIEDKIVSINVTEEIPIVDVIMELARMSGTDVQIDPSIVGGVNLNLRDKPLRYVFNRICGLTDTRYREKYGIVVFERDVSYAVNYSLDFLDMSRSSSTSITMNTSGLSSSVGTGGGTSTVATSSQDTFWDDVVGDIEQIVSATENTHKIYTTAAEKLQNITRADEKKQESLRKQALGIADDGKNDEISENKKTTEMNKTIASNSNSSHAIRVNKRAGIVTVTAGVKSHRLIEQYLEKLKRKVTAQVLIEMRLLEITLNKQYEAGINWGSVNVFGYASIAASNLAGAATSSSLATFTLNKGIDATAHMMEKFGSTRTLSNPRINAINNQPALMTFATNNVYFKVKAENNAISTASGTVMGTSISADAQTMPIGVIMSVLPSIDLEKRVVTLSMRPTISKSNGTVQDPTTYSVVNARNEVETVQVSNRIPVAQVRELDTILKLKDGQTAIIGGFTERKSEITEEGIPVLRAIPLLGNLFTHKTRDGSTMETVILVKATIVDSGKQMSDYEKDFYETMSDDPRSNEVVD